MDARRLTLALKKQARLLGFDLACATSAVMLPEVFNRLEQWLANGFCAEMGYFAEHIEAYRDPGRILPGARSILMLGMNYRTAEPTKISPGKGIVSRYAWGRDYHDVIHDRLAKLADFHRELVPHCLARGVVDTAPLFEKTFAQKAGLGWIGKNTLLINEHYGSWIFLGALLTTAELESDHVAQADHCGDCRACIDACPSGALVTPYRLDARRCISYLTKSKTEIPAELKTAFGDRVFGCDACQEACPWNRRTRKSREKSFAPRAGMNPIDLVELSALEEDGFRRRFRDTPLWQAKLSGMLRNAAIVLENQRAKKADS
ncbi:MAG: tRNA epoxyqueuosine(34) reductase QueG [Thermoguttaceae bacterium]